MCILFVLIRFLLNMSRSHLTSKSKYMYIYLHYIDSIFNKTKPILRTVKIISDIIFMTFKLICVFYIIVLFNSAFVVFLFFLFLFYSS